MKYTEINKNVLKQLHEVEMEILDEIVRICKKYDLQYFLSGGTLLGSVRHQGFIPWDDDMDIGMPRQDYDKFLEVAEKELGNDYFLHCEKTDHKYWLTFAKVRKNNTLFEEKCLDNVKNIKHCGIFVDIFPFDNAKAKESKTERLRAIVVKNIVDTLFYKVGVYQNTKHCRHGFIVKCLSILSFKSLHKLKYFMMTRNKNTNSDYIICYATGFSYPRDTHLRSDFFPTIGMKFENRVYQCPKKYDKYLTQGYGDYMKLPKKEDRVNHQTKSIVFDILEK